MDLPDPLPPPFSIVHRFRPVFKTTSCIGTELLYIGSCWSSCLCSVMWRGAQEYISYELACLLQQCSACLVRLTWIVYVMDGRWPYSCCFVGCYLHDLFNTARSILVLLPSSFFSIRLVSIHVVHPYCSIDTTTALKKQRFILSLRSDFNMTDSLSIGVHAFVSRVLMSFSIDDTLLPR